MVFGEVDKTDESMEVVRELEHLGNSQGGVMAATRPKIVDCGELPEEGEESENEGEGGKGREETTAS